MDLCSTPECRSSLLVIQNVPRKRSSGCPKSSHLPRTRQTRVVALDETFFYYQVLQLVSSQGSKMLCRVPFYVSVLLRVVYVGQTVRHLHTRVSEHLSISALTGKESSNPKLTSILQHLNNTGHTASLNDFKILSSSVHVLEIHACSTPRLPSMQLYFPNMKYLHRLLS